MLTLDRRRVRIGRRALAALVLALALAGGVAAAEPLRVRVGLSPDAPLAFVGPDGQPAGLGVEVLQEVARREGWELAWQRGTWEECLARLDRGELDLIPAISYTRLREERIAFTAEALVLDWGQVLALHGTALTDFDDLAGLTVAVMRGDLYGEQFGQVMGGRLGSVKLLPLDTYQEAVAALRDRRADAAIISRLFAIHSADTSGLTATPMILWPTEVRMAAARDRQAAVLAAIDRQVAAMKAAPDSPFHQARERWVTRPPRWSPPPWLLPLAGAALAVLAALAGCAWYLRRQVRAATRELSLKNAALARSEARYRDLVERQVDPLCSWRPDCTLTFANGAYARLFGKSTEELIGTNWLDLVEPHDREAVRTFVAGLIAAPMVTHYEHRVCAADGTVRWVNWSDVPVYGADGKLVSFESVGRDVTEHRVAESALQEANARLAHTLVELQTTQQQMIEQERLRALGQMASGIAHDFNNSLTVLQGLIELANLKLSRNMLPAAELQRYLSLMQTATQDAAKVVRRLREFYRHRDQREAVAAVDLNAMVRDTVELTTPSWKHQQEASGSFIQVELALHDVPPVAGVAAELREALTNLIMNAVTAMPQGGTLTLATDLADGQVRVQVRDTGVGMTDEQRRRCIEPFYTTKGPAGTGLGLSIVHGTVERHRGRLEITSEPGHGTTVALSFPPAIAATELRGDLAAARRQTSRHILVVDDEAAVRETVAGLLRELGHQVAMVASARQALAAVEAEPFDLVLTDLAMPEMNGEQLMAQLKARFPHLKVALMTGFGDFMRAASETTAHGDALLGKPFDVGEFSAVLDRLFPTPPIHP
jgi:PAS domain S-box-containing protein